MFTQQPRGQLRNVAAPGAPSGYKSPVIPAIFTAVRSDAKPLPPPPPGSNYGPASDATDEGEEEDTIVGGSPRHHGEQIRRTGTPPGSTSLIVGDKVYHVVGNPGDPGMPPTSRHRDVRGESREQPSALHDARRRDRPSESSSRRKVKPKSKPKSLAAPPAISSPVPFPQGSGSGFADDVERTFAAQQQAHIEHPHHPPPFDDNQLALVDDRSRTPSPPQEQVLQARLPQRRQNLLRRQMNGSVPTADDNDFVGDGPSHERFHQQQSTDDMPRNAFESENERGRTRRPSFSEGLQRSLSGAYRSVRAGLGKRISASMRRRGSTSRTRPDEDHRRVAVAESDVLDALVDRMRRNFVRAQEGFGSGGERRPLEAEDLPPEWIMRLKKDMDELILYYANQSSNFPLQARALAHIADIISSNSLAKTCFTQLNVIPPLEAIVRHSSASSNRRVESGGTGDGEQASGSAAEYADLKRGRISALHSGRRHWTTVHALVKRCKACLEMDNEVDRMCEILDGTRRIPSSAEGDLDIKIRVTTPDDALVGVVGYLRSASYAYPTTLRLRAALEREFPHQICVGEAAWAVLFATLCELITLFRLDPNLSLSSSVIDISRDRSMGSTEHTMESGQHPNGINVSGSPEEESLFVDSLHLKAVDELICAAMAAPAALSLAFANSPGGSANRRDRHGKGREKEPSPYVKMMRLLMRDDLGKNYPAATARAQAFIIARL